MARVLVVDDSATDRELTRGLLAVRGAHQVESVADAEAALEFLAEHPVDLVLTDLQMPGMDGLELVVVLRRQYPLLPVILMTGVGSEQFAVRALQAGAASYIPKASLGESLMEIVRRVLSAARDDRAQVRVRKFLVGQELDFQIDNDPELISPLVQSLQDAALEMGIVDEYDRIRLGVALQEALVNACFHGNLEVSSCLRESDHRAYYDLARQRAGESPYRERTIRVSARIAPDSATYVIEDEGPGFDLARLPDPTDPTNLERPCGRGLLLMQTFMDQVQYSPRGNQVTLVKRRPSSTQAVRGVPR